MLPAEQRRKRLLLCDMDSTIITIECIDELADFAGIKPQIAAVTRRAMNGELDFAAALRERVALLAGLPSAAIDAVIRERLRLMPGARDAGADDAGERRPHRAGVRRLHAPSRGTSQALCGFDVQEANELEIADGRLTGRARRRVARCRRPSSRPCCGCAQELGSPPCTTDGRGRRRQRPADAAGGRPGRRLPRPAARPRGRRRVRIDHGDLTALLFLQGYGRDEFVGG